MTITVFLVAGRICSVQSREGDTAFLSANDRSRWCTVASLVEDGTYVIDRQISLTTKKRKRPWYTIDMVRHRGADGQQHYYSSKPPLFPTMVAGVYKLVNAVTRMKITEQPIYVPRMILLFVNLPLLLLFLWSTISAVELYTTGEWSRRFTAAATCFGTMLTPFAITLNNHLPAAAATAFVVYCYLYIAQELEKTDTDDITRIRGWLWLAAGIAAGFTAANELPALSMLCLWGVLFWLLDFKGAMIFAVGVLIVGAAFFITNMMAHDSLRPPYAHRGNGDLIATVDVDTSMDDIGDVPAVDSIMKTLVDSGAFTADRSLQAPVPSGEANRWVVRADDDGTQFALIQDEANATWTIRHWDDWYDYPTSYWNDGKRKGVDLGEPSRLVYLANMTFGHYGIFSLTPLWLLVPYGVFLRWNRGPRDVRFLVWALTLASSVCFVFYLMRPEIDRNYGGVSSCFRWMLWFGPLWILLLSPAVERLSVSVRSRAVLLAMLGLSVFSMAISLSSPWQAPWIYRFWSFLGWIG